MSFTGKRTPACDDPPRQDGKKTSSKMWPLHTGLFVEDDDGAKVLKITIGFVGAPDGRRTAVMNTLRKGGPRPFKCDGWETWEDWANVRFVVLKDDEADTADIRIGFDKQQGPWSYIGQEANNYRPGKSINLGNIDSREVPDKDDFGHILHECGHALGLGHEHQSPNRDPTVLSAIRRNYNLYLQAFGSAEEVNSQMVAQLGEKQIQTATSFDLDSIMMYSIRGIVDKRNNRLSRIDKAFIMLLYPPDLTASNANSEKRKERFLDAMATLKISSTVTADILAAFSNPGPILNLPPGEELGVPERLEAMRQCFTTGSRRGLSHQSNGDVSHSIAPKMSGLVAPSVTKRFGPMDPLGDVVSNKLFRSIVKHVARNTLEQHGISMREPAPGASPTAVVKTMAAICTDQQIAHYVKACRDQFQGGKPSTPPAGTSLDVFQQVFSLSLASSRVSDVKGNQTNLHETLKLELSSVLPTIDTDWRLKWGPTVWKNEPRNAGTGPENAWYIAFHPRLRFEDGTERPTYVIAIAGTPQTSLHVWQKQNLAVNTVTDFMAWVKGGIQNRPVAVSAKDLIKGRAYIATGTANAVSLLLTAAAPDGAASAGKTLLDFIADVDGSVSPMFITTGHSLGGALSPSLALALALAGYIPTGSMLTYPFAGPSPGNAAFSELFSQTFPARKSHGAASYQGWNLNLVNTLDVVPQAWSTNPSVSPKQNLNNIPTIYGKPELLTVSLFAAFAKGLSKASGVAYRPLPAQYFTGLAPSSTPKDMAKFVQILVQQHTQAYIDHVGIATPPPLDRAQAHRAELKEKTNDEILSSYPLVPDLEWMDENPKEAKEKAEVAEGIPWPDA